MERFSHRESVLFGYSCPRVSFTNSNSPPKTPCRNSDFDFNDVFGGPPRRSSMQDKRFSFTESMDFYGNKEDDEALSCLVGEKPVFGEENMNRRRYTSDDFFDDIFRGDQSLSSTPRRRGKDPFSSAPGSRVLSPALPLPPKADPFGSSSLPPQFSLPAKLTKGVDSLVFGSSTGKPYKHKDGASNGIGFSSPSTSTPSRFSSQAIQTKEESGNIVQPPYHQSTLLPEISRSSEVSPDLISDEKDTKVDMEKTSHSSEVRSDGSKFHFSIYKWASKGVPLAMPFRGGSGLRLKEPAKIERCSSAKGWLVGESEVKESYTQSFRVECNKQDKDSVPEISAQDRVEPCQNVAEAILPRPESENLSSLQSFVEDIPGSTILQGIREEIKPPSLSLVDLCDQSEREIRVLTEEVYRPALKPVRSLFFDNDYEHGNDGTTEKGQGKETMVKSTTVDASKNVKKQDEKRPKVNDVLTNEASFQDSAVYSADKLGRNRVKGMVKEFVKIFNQEGSPQPKDDSTSRSENSKWKKRGTNRAESEVRISTIGVDEKTPRAKAGGYLKQTEKEHFAIKITNDVVGGTLSGQKDYSSSSTTSVLHGSKAAVEDTDESFQGNFLIKELTQGKNEPSQSGDTQEIQVIDAKVRQWSNGKTGNIRSLLSTLQYVLWPESGWKPVPLADIIDGTSVKRAYQKALLCLHPDKLQQKGAAWHQRYVAEIVFKILQKKPELLAPDILHATVELCCRHQVPVKLEAWTHFNSLGSL